MTNRDKLRNQIGQLCQIVDTIDTLRRNGLADMTDAEVRVVSGPILDACEKLGYVIDIMAMAEYRAEMRMDLEDAR